MSEWRQVRIKETESRSFSYFLKLIKMKKIIFNPDYALREEENYTLLYSRSSRVQKFKGDDNVITKIHPLHATILSQFNGCNFNEGVEKIAKIFSIKKGTKQYDKIKRFAYSCINNNNQYTLKDPYANYIFPRNLLIGYEEGMEQVQAPIKFYHNFFSKGAFLELHQRPKAPLDIVIMPTTNCLTNCIYCYANRNRKINSNISIKRYKEIIAESKKLGVRMVDIIGGDIFAYPKWFELLSTLKEYDYHKECLLSTKIPLNKDAIKKLHILGIERIQLSVDSLNISSVKNILRVLNSKAYVSRMIKTFELLQDYNIKVSVHTILTKQGATKNDLMSIYQVLKDKENVEEWRIDVAFSSMYSDISYHDYKVKDSDNKKLSIFINSLSKQEKKIKIINEIDEIDSSIERKKETFFYEKAVSCPANVYSCFILPDGKVTICEQFYWQKEYIIGDITKQSLLEIWNSDKALYLYHRKETKVRKISPCYNCSDKEICSSRKLVCWVDVVKKYGYENWDFPDPRCHKAHTLIANEK